MVAFYKMLGVRPWSFNSSTKGMFRFLHCSCIYQDVNKSVLSVLRRNTGVSIANCRKALDMHDNDPVKAEEWLRSQAKAMGCKIADKVKDREALNGLVGIAFNNKKVAMVEVNCETDFSSRNDKFRSMVELVAATCFEVPVLFHDTDANKMHLNPKEIGSLIANNVTLADHLTLLIGSMGENMSIRRAVCFETTRNDVHLAVGIHPQSNNSNILLGKYGSFLSIQRNAELEEDNFKNVCDNLCKHIIGMSPTKVGDYEKDKPMSNSEDETVLIYQNFVSDNSLTVGEYMAEAGVTVLDFVRFECGESLHENKEGIFSEENISVNG